MKKISYQLILTILVSLVFPFISNYVLNRINNNHNNWISVKSGQLSFQDSVIFLSRRLAFMGMNSVEMTADPSVFIGDSSFVGFSMYVNGMFVSRAVASDSSIKEYNEIIEKLKAKRLYMDQELWGRIDDIIQFNINFPTDSEYKYPLNISKTHYDYGVHMNFVDLHRRLNDKLDSMIRE
ncbi:MAG: hypothetical protein LCH53_03975 [Bacteroidetes bacterium]|nr:hypothetical protein [Bacteroidota bacterium]